VTKTSDQSYEKNELPPVYIFLVKYSDGRLGIARAVKPSQAQIEFMQEHLQQNPGSFKVVRVPDSDFILGAPAIGDDKYNVALSDEGKAMIQGFWDNGNDVSQQILQKQFGFGTFYVVMQRHGRTGQLLAWALKPMTPSAKKSLERRSVYNEIRLMKSKDQELFESLAEYSASTAAAGTTVAEVPELEQMWNEAKPFDTAKTAASFATEGVPDRKHEFGCVMLLPPQDIAEAVLELGKKLVHDDEVYEDPEDSSFGREMTPHTTALWGIKPEKVRDRIKKVLEQVTPREFRLMNVTFFDDNDDYDVVKFDLTGDDLYAFHDALLEEFPDTKQTFDFRPHMTISYVLKGKGAEICERAKEWEGLTVPVRAVDYSRQDGVHEYINIEDSKEKQANPKQRGADEWFKGSRVADAAGNPFTVYHGTTSKISAEPNKFVRGRIYYHGTSEEKAQQILRDGFIEPWDIVGKSNYSGSLTPVANRSYVTPDLDQAIRYAAPAPADYIAGARGYIFEIDGAALSDVIPDEDAILNILEDIQRGSNVTGIQSRHRLKKRIVDWLAQKYEAGTLKDGEHMNLDEAKVIAQQLPQDITLDILKMPVVGIANEGHIPFLDCYSFNYDALVRLGRLRAAGKPTNLKNWADLVAIGV
jgi:2'-5' RNA ligase